MTPAEHRAKCIEAMADAINAKFYGMADWLRTTLATAAFDALPAAGARVVPAEATEGMTEAADPESDCWFMERAINRAIAAGDLTNPEKKP